MSPLPIPCVYKILYTGPLPQNFNNSEIFLGSSANPTTCLDMKFITIAKLFF